MIDFLSITIDFLHEPFGSVRTIEREDNTGNTKRLSKVIRVNQVPIYVTSLNNGTQINIRGCPLKAFQGHNNFGTNLVVKLGFQLILESIFQLGFNATEDQFHEWRSGEFQLDEIHLTHRFPISGFGIRRVLSHIHRYSSKYLRPSFISKGVGVTLKLPHLEWMFYDKRLEFMDKRKKEHKFLEAVAGDRADTAKDKLLATASKSIRAELKLDRDYLRTHRLDRGKHWSIGKVKEVFVRELKLLRLGRIPSLPDLPMVYKQISDPKLRSIVILWANGEDLSNHYGRTTLQKYRKAIRDVHGFDVLKDQPVLESARINLSDVFNAANMLTGFPKWVSKYPELAFR
jgi:hypothetical protein